MVTESDKWLQRITDGHRELQMVTKQEKLYADLLQGALGHMRCQITPARAVNKDHFKCLSHDLLRGGS